MFQKLALGWIKFCFWCFLSFANSGVFVLTYNSSRKTESFVCSVVFLSDVLFLITESGIKNACNLHVHA